MKDDTLETVYADLKRNLNAARLNELSVEVIRLYRGKKSRALSRYAALLGIEKGEENISRLFARIIRCCHPDRLGALQREIDRCYSAGGIDELRRIRSAFLADLPPAAGSHNAENIDVEDYRFDRNDFVHGATDSFGDAPYGAPYDDFEYDDTIYDATVDRAGDVIGAIHDLFVGNLNITLRENDLNNLEGELDLSDCGIEELDGIEHCVNISVLNLSGNSLERVKPLAALTRLESLFLTGNAIENIDPLAAISGLRELDISFNRVEDITVLLGMRELAYVNLLENPVKTVGVIRALRDRGVIVIF